MPLKLSEFNTFTPAYIEGTVIGFNAFSGVFFTLDEEEFIHCAGLLEAVDQGTINQTELREDAYGERLLTAGFIIDQSLQERQAIKDRYHTTRDDFEGLSLTIAPTVSCNFACSYCFQEHPKRFMSDEDIENICTHVDQNLPSGETLGITWFGGEPLAAFGVLEKLTNRIRKLCDERDANFRQSMITNGSLLNEKVVEFVANQGNYDFLQITLDGPAEIHDTRRVTSAGKGTFDKIVKNLKKAKNKLPISIRVNIDKTNAEHVPDLMETLSKEGLANSVSIYFGHVLPYTDACGAETSGNAFSVEEFARIEAQLQFLMIQYGIRPGVDLPKPGFGSLCVADNKKGSVFAPGGLVFNCWNEAALPDAGASGNLTRGGTIEAQPHHKEASDTWDTYDAFAHKECQKCAVQPLCRGGCPWEARKKPIEGTGHCTPLKYNLPEQLRLYHLASSIDQYKPTRSKRPHSVAEAGAVIL